MLEGKGNDQPYHHRSPGHPQARRQMSSLPLNPSADFVKRNPHIYGNQTDRVAPDTERKPDSGHDALAAPEGASNNPGFRTVLITSWRTRLVDERNLFDKYFVDSLVQAGLLRDDSPAWCKVFVRQIKAPYPEQQCTEIIIRESK